MKEIVGVFYGSIATNLIWITFANDTMPMLAVMGVAMIISFISYTVMLIIKNWSKF